MLSDFEGLKPRGYWQSSLIGRNLTWYPLLFLLFFSLQYIFFYLLLCMCVCTSSPFAASSSSTLFLDRRRSFDVREREGGGGPVGLFYLFPPAGVHRFLFPSLLKRHTHTHSHTAEGFFLSSSALFFNFSFTSGQERRKRLTLRPFGANERERRLCTRFFLVEEKEKTRRLWNRCSRNNLCCQCPIHHSSLTTQQLNPTLFTDSLKNREKKRIKKISLKSLKIYFYY